MRVVSTVITLYSIVTNTKYLFAIPESLPDVFHAAKLRCILAATHPKMTLGENPHFPCAYLLLRSLFLGLVSFLFGRHRHGDNLLNIFLSRLLNWQLLHFEWTP